MTHGSGTWTSTQRAAVLAILILIGCGRHQGAQPRLPVSPQAALDEASRLEQAVEALDRGGKFREAIPLAKRSLELREQTLGPLHPDVATSLNNLAGILWAQGAYAKAEPLLVRAFNIWERALGPMHPDVALSLNNLAELYRTQGRYAQAEPLLIRAINIWEKSRGPLHSDVASSLNNLANLYQNQGAYAQAEPLLIRALDIWERLLGPMHLDVAISLNNLAHLYRAQGAHERAMPLLIRALRIREKELGGMHSDVAMSLNNLAELYRAKGSHAQAEPLYARALDIQEKTLGEMHPDVANTLNNLAVLYRSQGAYARAEPLYVRSLQIREKTLGPMHPALANSLNNLAALYRNQGAYTRAEPLLVRSIAIAEKALGPRHPAVATSLSNLGEIYHAQGLRMRAEPLYIRALDIQEKALGQWHPDVATYLNNLAMLYKAQGAYVRAEPLLVRALVIQETSLGPMHPSVAATLNNLAGIYWLQGAHARTNQLLARAAEIRERYLRIELTPLSAARKHSLMTLFQGEIDSVVSSHADSLPTNPHALELALITILRRKGRILDSLADHQAVLHTHLTPQLQGKLHELAEVNRQLSMRLQAPFDPRTAPRQQAAIAALHTHIDKLESVLNPASIEFRIQSGSVTVADVQRAIPRGSALIEFVRYHRFDAGRTLSHWQEARYVAYIVPWQGAPRWVALGAAAAIDARVDAVLAAMREDSAAKGAKAALRNLDALVYAPIRARLAGISHVILSPDGKLNLVPFEALVDPQGRYELEHRLVSYVTSGRDLLRLAARQAPQSPTTIVADPDYGSGTRFGRLAGVGVEVEEIRGRLPGAKVLMGAQATKTALAAVKGPAVLHIATHGFFARKDAAAPARVSTASERGMSVVGTALPPPSAEDPAEALDRAGLALAGANVGPDGIVSAREIAGFDWWGTQLVVLSACETGVGAVPSGEGVYGMRRALVLAGAQAQVVSLWNVSDSSAPVLMRDFYGELARGIGRAEALRRAKLRMLRLPRFAHPYYWAAFVSAGDWTPLDQDTIRRQESPR